MGGGRPSPPDPISSDPRCASVMECLGAVDRGAVKGPSTQEPPQHREAGQCPEMDKPYRTREGHEGMLYPDSEKALPSYYVQPATSASLGVAIQVQASMIAVSVAQTDALDACKTSLGICRRLFVFGYSITLTSRRCLGEDTQSLFFMLASFTSTKLPPAGPVNSSIWPHIELYPLSISNSCPLLCRVNRSKFKEEKNEK
ncbi:hypothetical protein LZ32DRAFT_335389 [Colletotrichum eremochloae]|nr:hypothetical protein LZ32DRAFT_335389 [Colletotrichum eremochloae]